MQKLIILSRDLNLLNNNETDMLYDSIEEASKFLNSYCRAIVHDVAINKD